jgi:hypothetical protein
VKIFSEQESFSLKIDTSVQTNVTFQIEYLFYTVSINQERTWVALLIGCSLTNEYHFTKAQVIDFRPPTRCSSASLTMTCRAEMRSVPPARTQSDLSVHAFLLRNDLNPRDLPVGAVRPCRGMQSAANNTVRAVRYSMTRC